MECLKFGEVEIKYNESDTQSSVLWERHCHSRLELIAVLEGDVSVMLEGLTYRLTSDQCIIVPPLAYHSVTINAGGIYRRVTALFPLDLVPEILHRDFTAGTAALFYSSCIERLKAAVQRDSHEFYAPLAKSLMVEVFYDMLDETTITVNKYQDDVNIPMTLINFDKLNYLANKPLSAVENVALVSTLDAHYVDGGVNNVVIELDQMNEYTLGQLMFFFCKACAMSAYLVGVNPFNQPGVEVYKARMKELLSK